MILDLEQDVLNLIDRVQDQLALVVPIFSSPTIHATQNPLVALYIYTEEDECIIPLRHTEQIRGFTEHVTAFLSLTNIFVHDKKQWLQIGGNGAVWDVKTLWWYTYGEAYDESYYPTAAHQFFWRRHPNLAHINAIVPLQQHLAMCQKIRHYAWPMCQNAERTASYSQFNEIYPAVFAAIERNGLQVTDTFPHPDAVINQRVYTQYNYHTVTGRPSNAARGFNFAAMNKEDGTRAAFCSRFDRGALVEMDFDSYHVRLIAKLIGYQFPITSVHDYLGRFYFDCDELTDAQRNESKSITFRLLYGGIDREFLAIPFFRQVNDFIYSLWNQWKREKQIETPILHRPITHDAVSNMTANKLFNYYLQALETEVSVKKLAQLQSILQEYSSCIILYTYDSVLIDVDFTEAKQLIPQLRTTLEQGGFPIKIKYGINYHEMHEAPQQV